MLFSTLFIGAQAPIPIHAVDVTVADIQAVLKTAPGYVPHWWSSVESDMTYLVIGPDPDKTLPLQ